MAHQCVDLFACEMHNIALIIRLLYFPCRVVQNTDESIPKWLNPHIRAITMDGVSKAPV